MATKSQKNQATHPGVLSAALQPNAGASAHGLSPLELKFVNLIRQIRRAEMLTDKDLDVRVNTRR